MRPNWQEIEAWAREHHDVDIRALARSAFESHGNISDINALLAVFDWESSRPARGWGR